MERDLYAAEHEAFRATVRDFVDRQVLPNIDRWEREHLIDRDTWRAAGQQGVVGLSGPAEYGGGGVSDYRFRNVVQEELARACAGALVSSFSLHDDIVMPYFAALSNADQRARWLPALCTGQTIAAIAMTEPDAGSDLRGIKTSTRRVDGGWLLNGAKTFITSGYQADLVIVVARTGEEQFSLLVVESGMPGFSRGRKLEKIGLAAQDTAELFFADVFVPEANCSAAKATDYAN